MTYNAFGGTLNRNQPTTEPTPTPLLPGFVQPRLNFAMAEDRL